MGLCASLPRLGGTSGVSVLASSSDHTEHAGWTEETEACGPTPGEVPAGGVLGIVDGEPGVLDVGQWTSHLDVPVVK